MLDLSLCGIIKEFCKPQNMYDGVILGLNYMPTKPVAIAMATVLSGTALYVLQPETLLNKVSVIVISSGLGWGAVVASQQIAGKLWDERWEEIKAEIPPVSMETNRKLEELADKMLDDLLGPSPQKNSDASLK